MNTSHPSSDHHAPQQTQPAQNPGLVADKVRSASHRLALWLAAPLVISGVTTLPVTAAHADSSGCSYPDTRALCLEVRGNGGDIDYLRANFEKARSPIPGDPQETCNWHIDLSKQATFSGAATSTVNGADVAPGSWVTYEDDVQPVQDGCTYAADRVQEKIRAHNGKVCATLYENASNGNIGQPVDTTCTSIEGGTNYAWGPPVLQRANEIGSAFHTLDDSAPDVIRQAAIAGKTEVDLGTSDRNPPLIAWTEVATSDPSVTVPLVTKERRSTNLKSSIRWQLGYRTVNRVASFNRRYPDGSVTGYTIHEYGVDKVARRRLVIRQDGAGAAGVEWTPFDNWGDWTDLNWNVTRDSSGTPTLDFTQ
ncbi:MAG: hypothetical protein ACK5MT_02755 [Actinomycetales bacterium]